MEEESDLPKIIVEGDSIIVFEENDWGEKDVKQDVEENEEEELSEENKKKNLDIENIVLHEDGLKGVLEEAVGGLSLESKNEETRGESSDLYKTGYKELYEKEYYKSRAEDENVGVGDMQIVGVDDLSRMQNKTRLESAGFKDFEAEKKREERRQDSDFYGR